MDRGGGGGGHSEAGTCLSGWKWRMGSLNPRLRECKAKERAKVLDSKSISRWISGVLGGHAGVVGTGLAFCGVLWDGASGAGRCMSAEAAKKLTSVAAVPPIARLPWTALTAIPAHSCRTQNRIFVFRVQGRLRGARQEADRAPSPQVCDRSKGNDVTRPQRSLLAWDVQSTKTGTLYQNRKSVWLMLMIKQPSLLCAQCFFWRH